MSRHLAECAGDDYCTGNCLYDGIPDPGILERSSDICDCDWAVLHHSRYCPDTPVWTEMCAIAAFDPNIAEFPHRFWNTWQCVVHGRIGDINGPVHYALCPIGDSLIGEMTQLSVNVCEPCKGSGSIGPFTCTHCGGTGFIQ